MSKTASKYRPRHCNECGDAYTPRRADEFFCSVAHRKAFDNRAMVRGRDLYHLFMALRYERGLARARGVWAIACRLAMVWREEDQSERDGRKSWMSVNRAIARLPVVLQSSDVFVGRDGTGRGRQRL